MATIYRGHLTFFVVAELANLTIVHSLPYVEEIYLHHWFVFISNF